MVTQRQLLGAAAVLQLCSLFTVCAADDEGITCYGWDGLPYANNTICPNSQTCCGIAATCLSNRLCHNPGDNANTFVRGPCARKGWDSACANICQYNETDASGVLPRVTPCSDGSFCCNNDPQCCGNGNGVFLDATGAVVSSATSVVYTSYPPASSGTGRVTQTPSTSSTSSAATATSSDAAATSAGASASTTSGAPAASSAAGGDDSSSSTSTGLKVGLGLGIPLAALVAGIAVFLLLRMRRKANAGAKIPGHGSSQELDSTPPGQPELAPSYYQSPSAYPASTYQGSTHHGSNWGADGSDAYGAYKPMQYYNSSPTELPVTNMAAAELDHSSPSAELHGGHTHSGQSSPQSPYLKG